MSASDVLLAPMVRLGTLPLRLLSLERGAALVYSEEIIDGKLAKAQRTVDARLGTVDWRVGGGIVLRTCQEEHGKLVVQLGTADVATALMAIKALDVDPQNPLRDFIGVDVNMGCPKRSAEAGGSGGALFSDSERAEAIVRALRKALPSQIRLSCKVRLHHSGPDETIRRCSRLVDAGASAIAVHARYATERSCDLARWQELGVVASALRECGVEVLLNGDVLDAVAAAALRLEAPGCRLMVGRGALHAANDVFGAHHPSADGRAAPESAAPESAAPESAAPLDDSGLDDATLQMCTRYAKLAIQFENPPLNSAFVLQWMLHARLRERSPAVSQAGALPPQPAVVLSVQSHAPVQPEAAGTQPEAAGTQSEAAGAGTLTIESVAAALRGASTMHAIASALDLTSFLDEAPRGTPAAPTHRYTPTYFTELDRMSDWARAPSRATLREAHAAVRAPLVTNGDFSRLVQSRVALAVKCSSGSGGSAGAVADRAAGSAAAGTEDATEEDAHTRLLRAVGPHVRVKYYVLQETAPAAKALGYFAAAWQCRAVVGGRPFDGALRKSRYKAEQHAAQVAIEGLAACPLDPAKARRRAKRDSEKKRKRPSQ